MGSILFKTNFYSACDDTKFSISLAKMKHRGQDESAKLYHPLYSMGVNRAYVLDKVNGIQPISNFKKHLILTGSILNTEKLLNDYAIEKEGHSDTSNLLELISKKGLSIIPKLEGAFGFIYTNYDKVYVVRDKIGIKSLYYTIFNGDLIVASEIKALLEYGVEAVMTKEEVTSLLAINPGLKPGHTLFKGIYEVKPGHYLEFSKEGLKENCYFKLERKKNELTYDDSVSMTRYLVDKSISLNQKTDLKYASLLSGGLDSTIVAFKLGETCPNLATFSIDYEGNKTDYQANAFEKSRDEESIEKILKIKDFNHLSTVIDTNTLFDYLKTTVILRDGPGMTDIDSSLFYLVKTIKEKGYGVALSGEGADELFGGYPWYRSNDEISTFPWSKSKELRNRIKNKKLNLDLDKYIDDLFNEAKVSFIYSDDDSDEVKKDLFINYLNIYYFMPTLLKRKDVLTQGVGLEARVPFLNSEVVSFAYNLPKEYKVKDGIEKSILRDSYKNLIPSFVYNRKKSPFPKSHSKKWHEKIKKEVEIILEQETILTTLFDIEEIRKIINSDEELETPWFGQLMRKDALLAFLWQIDFWFKEYKIRLEI